MVILFCMAIYYKSNFIYETFSKNELDVFLKRIIINDINKEVEGKAVLGRQNISPTPWLTERHGYDPTCFNG